MESDKAEAPIAVGELLAGKYRVEKVLGQGGMGVVVAARHIDLDDRVALKFLLPEVALNGEIVARFLREGKAARKIRGEHVAKVTDVGRLDNGSPYMVMEYLEGSDLGEIVVERGPLAIPDAIELLLQACEALAEAHAAGVVHRDLKPANLFLTARVDGTPCVKVLDFGISKVMTPDGKSDSALTRTSGIMGSPLYMSPEQLSSSRDVDHRTDVWALGVVLFELLTGQQPFTGEDLPRVIAQILASPPASLRSLRPEAPPQLEVAVLRCLEKDRTRRFANIGELVQALAPFAPPRAQISVQRVTRIGQSVGVLGDTVNVSSDRISIPNPLTQPMTAQTFAPVGQTNPAITEAAPKKRSALPFVAIGALVVAAAIGGVFAFGRSSAPSNANAPAAAAKEADDEHEPAPKHEAAKEKEAPKVVEAAPPPATTEAAKPAEPAPIASTKPASITPTTAAKVVVAPPLTTAKSLAATKPASTAAAPDPFGTGTK